ncbi:aquaporin [Streptomyces sp. NPDC087263]|uniref:aquaporin n=1 Tax=Streptomyces sp. NPDC087263 TaxID=3365773 RepID=UPI0038107CE9
MCSRRPTRSLATVFGLAVLITPLGPVSDAHFNPVTLAAWFTGRRDNTGPALREVAAYVPAQVAGAIGGAVLADAMFAKPLVTFSTHDRHVRHRWLAEAVATAGLILLIFSLERIGRAAVAPDAVASYIGAAYWFTSSTSFANPAVTVGRALSTARAPLERGVARLKSWRIFRKDRRSPNRMTSIAAAVLTLEP